MRSRSRGDQLVSSWFIVSSQSNVASLQVPRWRVLDLPRKEMSFSVMITTNLVHYKIVPEEQCNKNRGKLLAHVLASCPTR